MTDLLTRPGSSHDNPDTKPLYQQLVDSDDYTIIERDQRSFIAGLIRFPDTILDAVQTVQPQYLTVPRYRLIYEAIIALTEGQVDITRAGVADILERTGQLANAGGPKELEQLFYEGGEELLRAPASISARRVRDGFARSEAFGAFVDGVNLLRRESGKTVEEAVGLAQEQLYAVLAIMEDTDGCMDLAEESQSYLDKLAWRSEQTLVGWDTPWPTLTEVTNGLTRKKLYTIAGRPGTGKSIGGGNLALCLAQQGANVLMFNLEMPNDDVMDRMIASEAMVASDVLASGKLNPDEWDRVRMATELFASYNIKSWETPFTYTQIRAMAKQHKERYGLDAIVIDYAQLITDGEHGNENSTFYKKVANGMKTLAKSLDVAIILLLQVGEARSEQHEEGKEHIPKVRHIRDSSAFHEASDLLMLIWRDEEADRPRTYFSISKHRNGRTGTFVCESLYEYSIFREVRSSKDAMADAVADDEFEAFNADTPTDPAPAAMPVPDANLVDQLGFDPAVPIPTDHPEDGFGLPSLAPPSTPPVVGIPYAEPF